MVCSTVGEQLNDACGMNMRTGLHLRPGRTGPSAPSRRITVRFSFGNFSAKIR